MPFHQPATRSELSGNWRASPVSAVPCSSENIRRHGDLNDNPSLQDLQSSNSGPENGTIASVGTNMPNEESVRGEDDPRTLQAIAEGRRLYVGNLPYMAKSRDVMDLFSYDYQV